MKNLYLLRGIPGSGKSTLANQFGDVHFEADMYFINENGEYIFNGADIKKAHQWCQSQVELAMIQNHITDGLDSSDLTIPFLCPAIAAEIRPLKKSYQARSAGPLYQSGKRRKERWGA